MDSRFVRFNGVGVMGFVVQLAALGLLLYAGVHYLVATAIAVEAAVLHNFCWHERWTWIDRPATGRARLGRLWRFHALNGVVSLGGNMLLVRLLAGSVGLPVVPASAVSVLVCSLLNFALTDSFVFDQG
jgi:dolichol-phosphate mannosyltransferase